MSKPKTYFTIIQSVLLITSLSQPVLADNPPQKPTRCPSAAAILEGIHKNLGNQVYGNSSYPYKYEFPAYKYKFGTENEWMVGIYFSILNDDDGAYVPVKALESLGNYTGVPILQSNNSSWVCTMFGSVKKDNENYGWALVTETEA